MLVGVTPLRSRASAVASVEYTISRFVLPEESLAVNKMEEYPLPSNGATRTFSIAYPAATTLVVLETVPQLASDGAASPDAIGKSSA